MGANINVLGFKFLKVLTSCITVYKTPITNIDILVFKFYAILKYIVSFSQWHINSLKGPSIFFLFASERFPSIAYSSALL